MQLNPKIEEYAKQNSLDVDYVKLFCLAIVFECFEPLLYIMTADKLDRLRIDLCTKNFDNNKLMLKFDLFHSEDKELVHIIKELKTNYGFTSNGHPNHRKNYTVLSTDADTEKALERIIVELGSKYDRKTVVDTIANYYAKTEYPQKLLNYLNNVLLIDYGNNKPTTHDIML